jgi:hypothetical protein
MVTFPSLLNVGEPLIFQGVPAPRTVSPFASQLTSTGLLPLPAVPTAAPVPVPTPTPAAPVLAEPLLPAAPSFSGNVPSSPDYETPTGAVSFTSNTSAPSTSAIGAAEAFGLTPGTPDEIASAYATQRADEVSPRMSFNNLGDVFSQPLSQTLDQVFSRPEAIPGAFLGMAVPGAGIALSAMSHMSARNNAYNRAMAEMNQPGYSYGTINGQKYTISPGLFGYGRVMHGVLPSWFDIDMHDKMQSLELGIEPGTGETLSGFTPGVGGYNSKGQFVDAYGNISAMGTMQNAQNLADKQGISLQGAREALTTARLGQLSLKQALLDTYNTERGFTDMVGPPNYDINADPLSGMIDYSYYDDPSIDYTDVAPDTTPEDDVTESGEGANTDYGFDVSFDPADETDEGNWD